MSVSIRQQIATASYLARIGLAEHDPSGLRSIDDKIADAIIAKVPEIAALVEAEGIS